MSKPDEMTHESAAYTFFEARPAKQKDESMGQLQRSSKTNLVSRWTLFPVLALAGSGLLFMGAGRVGTAANSPQALEERELPFKVPPGFVAELVAGPPLVEYPMFACFDDRGRLFVVDSAGVNLLPDELSRNPPHRIRLLEDTRGDGRYDKSTVFADKLTYPQGVLWHDGAVYTSSPPSLWRLEDTKGQGVADKREELATGFTFTKWADDLHGPFLGPDGRVYWTSGRYAHSVKRPGGEVLVKGDGPRILRCRPDGGEVEAFCSGIGNPVEVAFTPEGELFAAGTFANRGRSRDDVVFHGVYGGVYPILDRDVNALRGIHHTGEPLPVLVHFGVVAPSGLMRNRDSALGAAYKDNLFTALFGARAVRRHILKRDGATFQAQTEDFLVAQTDNFHPTDVLEDADGSLLIVDTGNWYNLCPSSQVGKTPVKGGIYRLRRKDATPVKDPRGLALEWNKLSPHELATLLDDPRFAVRDHAVEQLAKEGTNALADLKEAVVKGSSVRTRRNAVWALTRIYGKEARDALRPALKDEDASVRQAAVHATGLHRDAGALPRLMELVKTDTPPVRREAATALGRIQNKDAVPVLLEELTSTPDRFLEHSLIDALIRIADRPAMITALRDARAAVRRGVLITLDQMEDGKLSREMVTPLLDPAQPILRDEALHVLATHPEWAKEMIEIFRRWLFEDKLEGQRPEDLQRLLIAYCHDSDVQESIALALRRQNLPADTRLLLLETIAQAPLDKLPVTWVAELRWALDHREERIVRQAVAVLRAGGVADCDHVLLRLAADESRAVEVRAEALAAAAPRIDHLESAQFDFLEKCLDKEKPPLLRLAAASALGQATLNERQLKALTKNVASAGPLEMYKLLAAYERSDNPEVGKALLAALTKAPGLQSVNIDILNRTLKRYPEAVQKASVDLRKKLTPDAEKQAARLDELKPLLAKGDHERGREIFFGKKAICSTCHTVQSQGGRIGPDLSKIAATRSGPDLLEAVVFPSASFARGYEPYRITMRNGKVYDGIIGRETPEALYLVTTDRAEIRLARSGIDTVEPSKVSIMPQGLDTQLTKQELSDVLAFLQSLQ
jgi:putative membrane-bound dehydrogenase-like protein